jgi:hypothetical protein
MVMSSPTINLTYSLPKSEFALTFKNATKASYTIEYQAKKDKETVLEALKGEVTGKGTLSATNFAGTESAGAKVPHTVVGGTLKAIVTGTDSTQTEVTQVFTVSAQGQLKVTSEESSKIVGSVLGASTDDMSAAPLGSGSAKTLPKPVATLAPLSAQDKARQETLETTEEPSSTGINIPVMPAMFAGIGLILLGLIVLLMWMMKRGNSATPTSSQDQMPPAPPTAGPQT